MFRHVLYGLAVAGMMGSVAFGAPILTVTDNVIIRDSGVPYSEITYEPGAVGGPYNPDDTVTLYFFIEKLDEAFTPVGPGVNAVVASLGYHMEESGDGLAFSDPVVRYGWRHISGVGWLDPCAAHGWCYTFADEDLTPRPNGDEDWGWAAFTSSSGDIGSDQKFVGTIEVEILAHADLSNSDVQIEPARAPAPGDTTMTQLTLLDDGTLPDDVVINYEIVGLVGVPLGVPEPATMALLLAGCSGVIARRRSWIATPSARGT